MKLHRPLLFLASVVALGGVALPARAQEKSAAKSAPSKEISPDQARRLERPSALTDEQRQKLSALREQQREKIRAIRDDVNLTPEQKRAKLRESLASARDEASDVLTPEQKQKMKKLRHHAQAHRRHAMRARGHHRAAAWPGRHAAFGRQFGHHGRGPGAMFRHHGPRGRGFGGPGFAPGFQRGPRAGFGPQRGHAFGGAPFAGLDLTDEQKTKLQALRKEQHEQMQESMKSFQEQMRSVLTPEQQEKLARRRR